MHKSLKKVAFQWPGQSGMLSEWLGLKGSGTWMKRLTVQELWAWEGGAEYTGCSPATQMLPGVQRAPTWESDTIDDGYCHSAWAPGPLISLPVTSPSYGSIIYLFMSLCIPIPVWPLICRELSHLAFLFPFFSCSFLHSLRSRVCLPTKNVTRFTNNKKMLWLASDIVKLLKYRLLPPPLPRKHMTISFSFSCPPNSKFWYKTGA